MSVSTEIQILRRTAGDNVWLSTAGDDATARLARLTPQTLNYEVLASEDAVGRTMLEEIDQLLGRLSVFTQDALAPLRSDNSLSFVRDFERLLGADFFRKVKSFTSMPTETKDLEAGLIHYLEELESRQDIDLFFLGLGPGAGATDLAGVIPVSSSILEHHITKFKAGGSAITESDEAECRRASHILTLGPAAILCARRIVQSIVDADTAPAKRASFRRLIETQIASNVETRQRQMDENPGLWIRLHPNVRSLILPN